MSELDLEEAGRECCFLLSTHACAIIFTLNKEWFHAPSQEEEVREGIKIVNACVCVLSSVSYNKLWTC